MPSDRFSPHHKSQYCVLLYVDVPMNAKLLEFYGVFYKLVLSPLHTRTSHFVRFLDFYEVADHFSLHMLL